MLGSWEIKNNEWGLENCSQQLLDIEVKWGITKGEDRVTCLYFPAEAGISVLVFSSRADSEGSCAFFLHLKYLQIRVFMLHSYDIACVAVMRISCLFCFPHTDFFFISAEFPKLPLWWCFFPRPLNKNWEVSGLYYCSECNSETVLMFSIFCWCCSGNNSILGRFGDVFIGRLAWLLRTCWLKSMN